MLLHPIEVYQQAESISKQNILAQDLSIKESEIAKKLHLKSNKVAHRDNTSNTSKMIDVSLHQ